MKNLIISLLSCLAVLGIYGNADALVGVIPTGKVIDTVKCIYDRQQSYAVYLPSYYNTINRYPIVYIFDPAARGVLPVKMYHQLAEEFGFILVCSNNSQNGPQDRIDMAYEALFNDTKIRFMEDSARFYTMGFSGGARVAARIAARDKNIKGVIACGAGFPHEYRPQKGMNFSFVGLVGDLDMNFYEMKGLEATLEEKGIRHSMLYYHDNHRWPPVEEMYDAFTFIYFDAMRRGLTEKEPEKITKYKMLKINILDTVQDICVQYDGYEHLYQCLTDLGPLHEIEARLNELRQSNEIEQCIGEEQTGLKKETRLAEKLDEAFYNAEKYDLSWWKKEAEKLNKILNDSANNWETGMAKRMINKIYALAMENYWLNHENMSMNDFVRIFKIAAFAKPDSPYPDYYLAGIYAKNKKNGPALKYLQKSIMKGFSNLAYLQVDRSFDNIRTNKKYLELENQLKAH